MGLLPQYCSCLMAITKQAIIWYLIAKNDNYNYHRLLLNLKRMFVYGKLSGCWGILNILDENNPKGELKGQGKAKIKPTSLCK